MLMQVDEMQSVMEAAVHAQGLNPESTWAGSVAQASRPARQGESLAQ